MQALRSRGNPKDDANDLIAKFDEAGHFWTYGNLYKQVSPGIDLDSLAVECIRFKDDADDTVAMITAADFNNSSLNPVSLYTVPAGSVILRGKFFSGWLPDRFDTFTLCL